MKKLQITIMLAAIILLFTATVEARSMRHDGQMVKVGDSVADVAGKFGKPKMKVELGELDEGDRRCKVQLWIYEWFPWRYELKIGMGKVLHIKKVRLRKKR